MHIGAAPFLGSGTKPIGQISGNTSIVHDLVPINHQTALIVDIKGAAKLFAVKLGPDITALN
jgi:hypothetical protein